MHVTLVNDTRQDRNPGCQATVSSLVCLLEESLQTTVRTLPLGTGYDHFLRVPAGAAAEAAWRLAVDDLERDLAVRDAFKDASRIVVNLEGTFHHHTVGALALGGLIAVAHRQGLPVWAVNGTVEGVEPWLLKATLATVEYLAVREPMSAVWLEEQGLSPVLSADCAVLADVFQPFSATSIVPARSALYTPGVFGRSDQSRHVAPDDVVTDLRTLEAAGWHPVYFEMEAAEFAISERVREQGWPVVRVNDVPWQSFGTWLRQFDLVVSGRYHVLLFAAMAGTPWIAMPSNTWKIDGLLAHLDDARGIAVGPGMLEPRLAEPYARRDMSAIVERNRQFAALNVPSAHERWQRPSRALICAPSSAVSMPVLVPAKDVVHVSWPPERAVPGQAAGALVSALTAVPVIGGTRLVAGLERVAPADLADVLFALRDTGDGPVAVTVDTAPSEDSNRTHLTIRPASLWRRMFIAAGFEVLTELEEPNTATPRAEEDWSVRQHWTRLNPFRDLDGAHRRSFLLRALPDPAQRESSRQAIELLLGVMPRAMMPPTLVDPTSHVVFLVGTYQEFRQYLAIWPHLPAGSFSVLLRGGLREQSWTRRARCIEAWLAGRGIEMRTADSVRGVPWSSYRQQRIVLVTGADSSAYDSHMWNSAMVVSAREHGWRTVQLQHGVWPYADLRRPMTMLADVMLTWSGEFEREMDALVTWPDGTTAPRGSREGMRYVATGNPLFDRYAAAFNPSLEELLGDWVSGFERRILVATNLHWTQHADGARVDPALLELATRMPETLFIAKLHPVHDVDEAFMRACPPNVHVLDEFACLFADLDSARLVAATDGVVATQSTVALEAALARKPFVVMETGNPNRYQHVSVARLDQLVDQVETMTLRAEDVAFRDHYFDATLLGAGLANVTSAIAAELDRPAAVRSDSIALSRFAEFFSVYASELLGTQAELADVRTAHAALQAGRDALASHADAAEARANALDAIQASLFAELQAQARASAAELETQARWVSSELQTQTLWFGRELADVQAQLEAAQAAKAELENALAQRDQALLVPRLGRRVRVGFFGASATGRQHLARVRGVPHLEARCFVDNNSALWMTTIEGLPVLRPEPAVFDDLDVIVISSAHVASITAQIGAAGYAHKLLFDAGALERLALRTHTA